MSVELSVAVLPNGKSFVFEEDSAPPGGSYPASLTDLKGRIDFKEALETIKEAASALMEGLRSLEHPPDVSELTFGIKLSAAAGVILARAGAEANFSVKMSWSTKSL